MSEKKLDSEANNNNEEVSGKDLLLKLLSREDMSDVFLEGTDGVRVPANRCILGAKSEVFEKMLYSEFKEASNSVIKLGFEGRVLKSLVEYVYTDNSEILKDPKIKKGQTKQQIQTIISLYGAGTYFGLPGLCNKSIKLLIEMIEVNPTLSFALLEVGASAGPAFPSEIKEAAMEGIRKKSITTADGSSEPLIILSPAVLEGILKDGKLRMPEIDLFNILQLWANTKGDNEPNRHDIACELSKHIRLDLIDPVHLSDVVGPSGLVLEKQMQQAYKEHALRLAANETKGKPTKKARYTNPHLWRDSSSDVLSSNSSGKFAVYLLDYPAITSGIHQWTIEVEEICYCTWLGIAHTGFPLDMQKFLGNQPGGRVCSQYGTIYHNSKAKNGFPKFEAGSKVTLTLNLCEGGGTLAGAVNGGAPFTLFSNLQSELQGRDGGFVPAASLKKPGRIRILDIHKLQE